MPPPCAATTRLTQDASCSIGRRLLRQNRRFLTRQSSPRPQLPFLISTAQSYSHQISVRLLSTEQKQNLKTLISAWTKWAALAGTVIGLVYTARFGVENAVLELEHPTPHELSWISRWRLRTAIAKENEKDTFVVDWYEVGQNYMEVIRRLEDVEIDGSGIRPRLGDDEDILVEGIGKTGLDISAKPEPWTRGYHEGLMGAARAAEQLETWVLDRNRDKVFPKDTVVGPSNPRPKPVPLGYPAAPKEADCEPAFSSPHVFYIKILTTHGFTSRQRMDAALAYAAWLEFKGLVESAKDMYSWAMDIATANCPEPELLPIDKSTGVLRPDASNISSNLMLVASSLAAYYARIGNLADALPIYLSVLRVQQQLPEPTQSSTDDGHKPSFLQLLAGFFSQPPYPPSPGSGDELATDTPTNKCAAAGTMLHIGEILFVSDTYTSLDSLKPSHLQVDGLSWTRKAVDTAEAILEELVHATVKDGSSSIPFFAHRTQQFSKRVTDLQSKQRCAECLLTGLKNWQKMVERFQKAESNAEKRSNMANSGTSNGQSKASKRWFWGTREEFGSGAQALRNPLGSEVYGDRSESHGTWNHEERSIQIRATAARHLLRTQALDS